MVVDGHGGFGGGLSMLYSTHINVTRSHITRRPRG